MWWKLALATLLGVAIGIAATIIPLYLYNSAISDIRADYIPQAWSSAGKEWPAFADLLHHGGRKLVLDAAFSAAKVGMSEAEVRATFGPPDLVAVGPEELNAYSVRHISGPAGGAYFYKIGPFADLRGKIISEVFTIIFDPAGKVMHRMGFGLNDGDRLADVDSDTRNERRISP